jgi:thiol-disulfide isomerase/thioredoxin
LTGAFLEAQFVGNETMSSERLSVSRLVTLVEVQYILTLLVDCGGSMPRLSKYRVLIAGVVSPLAALILYSFVYSILTNASSDREKDWLFRLFLSALAMTVPFMVTLALAITDRRRRALTLSGKIGSAIAILSLGLAWSPVSDGITRWKQSRNMALRDVAAPDFVTLDLSGKTHHLRDQEGKVVLVNIWATWCGPCRAEMPRLDWLYQERKEQGLMVFGLSDEDVDVQRKFLEQVPVSYPLLTIKGNVPNLYRDIARYPAIFLIDRRGRLQPAPGPDRPFEDLVATIVALLREA